MTDSRRDLLFRLLFLGLVVGNALVVYDWWRDTPQGQAVLARAHEKLAACAGCARRREAWRKMVNRVHWDAQRIVEGEDVPTVPEPEAP